MKRKRLRAAGLSLALKFNWDAITIRERTIGTDSLSVQLGVDVTKTVYFKLFLFKPGPPVVKDPYRGEVIYDTRTTGTYSG